MADISKRKSKTLNANRFNYAIYRVLLRMMRQRDASFAVFVRDQVVHFMDTEADYYEAALRRDAGSFAGVFCGSSDVEEIIAALKPHFTEERALIESHLYV